MHNATTSAPCSSPSSPSALHHLPHNHHGPLPSSPSSLIFFGSQQQPQPEQEHTLVPILSSSPALWPYLQPSPCSPATLCFSLDSSFSFSSSPTSSSSSQSHRFYDLSPALDLAESLDYRFEQQVLENAERERQSTELRLQELASYLRHKSETRQKLNPTPETTLPTLQQVQQQPTSSQPQANGAAQPSLEATLASLPAPAPPVTAVTSAVTDLLTDSQEDLEVRRQLEEFQRQEDTEAERRRQEERRKKEENMRQLREHIRVQQQQQGQAQVDSLPSTTTPSWHPPSLYPSLYPQQPSFGAPQSHTPLPLASPSSSLPGVTSMFPATVPAPPGSLSGPPPPYRPAIAPVSLRPATTNANGIGIDGGSCQEWTQFERCGLQLRLPRVQEALAIFSVQLPERKALILKEWTAAAPELLQLDERTRLDEVDDALQAFDNDLLLAVRYLVGQRTLVAMGFSQLQAREALLLNSADTDKAIQDLLDPSSALSRDR